MIVARCDDDTAAGEGRIGLTGWIREASPPSRQTTESYDVEGQSLSPLRETGGKSSEPEKRKPLAGVQRGRMFVPYSAPSGFPTDSRLASARRTRPI
jgi:hypothetical protein